MTDARSRREPADRAIASKSRTAYRRCSHSSSRMVCTQDRVVSGYSGAHGFRRVTARSAGVTVARKSRTKPTRSALTSSTSAKDGATVLKTDMSLPSVSYSTFG